MRRVTQLSHEVRSHLGLSGLKAPILSASSEFAVSYYTHPPSSAGMRFLLNTHVSEVLVDFESTEFSVFSMDIFYLLEYKENRC